MKNVVVRDMICSQFGFDFRDVDVEFISCIESTYEFKVTRWKGEYTKRFTVKISVEEVKE